jgi:hypothetical protein
MARPTLVWLCPYDGVELGGRAVQGTFQRQCPACAHLWELNGDPVFRTGAHNKRAIKATEMR